MQGLLLKRWSEFWRQITTTPPAEGAELLAAYSQSHRHYHTLQHLDECLRLLDESVAPHHGAAICGLSNSAFGFTTPSTRSPAQTTSN